MEKAIEVKDLADGQIKTVDVNGVLVAIAHVGDSFFAVDDTCSHAECSLGTDGFLTGTTVMCACHGATFDMTNGKALTLPATVDVCAYSVKIQDGWVYIEKAEK
jgi:3-phenylpropionate/trans-cinnamate dioxygenase ferredoxin component